MPNHTLLKNVYVDNIRSVDHDVANKPHRTNTYDSCHISTVTEHHS
jgi:hypothetical protein